MDDDPRFPRLRPNGDRSLGEVDRLVQDLRQQLREHNVAHVNSRDLEAISSRLDTLQGTIRKLWWGIAIQTSIIILTLIIGAIVAGIVRAVVGGP